MIAKEILEELYQNKGLSVARISLQLGVSRNYISNSLERHGMNVRTKQEQAYVQHNKSFKIKHDLNHEEKILYGVGLGLYWGEGNKVSEYSVRLGNTDEQLIKTFVAFLKGICGVEEQDIKYGLQLFNDSNVDDSLSFWMKHLECTKDSFHKTVVIIPPQGKGTYRRKSQHGVLQVYVNNKRLKEWLMAEIAKYADVAQG